MKPNSKEVKRAWKLLADHFKSDGKEVNGFEAWQWMGLVDGHHEFRHRSHPVHGRITWRTPATSKEVK